MTHQSTLCMVGMATEIHEGILFRGCSGTLEKELLEGWVRKEFAEIGVSFLGGEAENWIPLIVR